MSDKERFYDLDLPPLPEENLPEAMRASLYDPHFTHEKGEQVIFRLDPKAVLALDLVKEWPNVPQWMRSRSGVLRFCVWVGLSLFATMVDKPNSRLTAIMAAEALEGKRKTRKLINESLTRAIESASEDVAELMKLPNSEGEVRRIIEDLITYIYALDGEFWQDKWIGDILMDKTLAKAIRELGLGGLLNA